MKSKKTRPNAKCYTLYAILTGCLLILVGGCENGNKKSPLVEQIQQLKQEKTQLTRQIERSTNENKQLKKQIQVLSGLGDEVELESLYGLQRIEIGGYTGFYDKDKDGQCEKLIVYIKPIDGEGDIVKATGAVDVQLWDLNKEAHQALLGRWRITPGELKKLWFATLLTINYRLTFDIADTVENMEEPLTLKVTFTDYLTGKVFKEQKVIKPR